MEQTTLRQGNMKPIVQPMTEPPNAEPKRSAPEPTASSRAYTIPRDVARPQMANGAEKAMIDSIATTEPKFSPYEGEGESMSPPTRDYPENPPILEEFSNGGDMAGPGEETTIRIGNRGIMGEGTSAALGACEERASAPCSGHGQYRMAPAPMGLMDVSCHCDRGWIGPDCKARCPMGQMAVGGAMPCTGNGECRSHQPTALCN